MPKTTEVHDIKPRVIVDGDTETIGVRHCQASPRVEEISTPRPSGEAATGAETAARSPSASWRLANGFRKAEPRASGAMSTTQIRQAIRLRALLLANRFRVIRTIDVAVHCFPERGFKAALTAAQRAMRGLVKEKFLRRHKTERFQTVYGLTERGATWLEEQGCPAASSIRRVLDMTNPEHKLWSGFLVLASQARGLEASTEQDLMKALNKVTEDTAQVHGLLTISQRLNGKDVKLQLRPDAVAYEPDGLTWFEVDRSKRGDRTAALAALVSSVGVTLGNGQALRRVVVFCKTERVLRGAHAVMNEVSIVSNEKALIPGRCHYKMAEPGTWEVWRAIYPEKSADCVDVLVGHIIIQLLPTWLPKVRIDSQNRHSLAGWFDENYLPYRRPTGSPPWQAPTSPLLPGPESAKAALRWAR